MSNETNTEYLVVDTRAGGIWARGSDLQKLFRDVLDAKPSVVAAAYRVTADRKQVRVTAYGEIEWSNGYRPEPLGLFHLKKKQKPSPVYRGQFNESHLSSEEWVASWGTA